LYPREAIAAGSDDAQFWSNPLFARMQLPKAATGSPGSSESTVMAAPGPELLAIVAWPNTT
jgi:hypothetical protein